MTREEAHEFRNKYNSPAEIIALINQVYDDFEKEKEQLKKDRNYWKLSFEKQVEASRRKNNV